MGPTTTITTGEPATNHTVTFGPTYEPPTHVRLEREVPQRQRQRKTVFGMLLGVPWDWVALALATATAVYAIALIMTGDVSPDIARPNATGTKVLGMLVDAMFDVSTGTEANPWPPIIESSESNPFSFVFLDDRSCAPPSCCYYDYWVHLNEADWDIHSSPAECRP